MSLWVVMALGGLVSADATSVGQTMISRPLVAGLLTGVLVGDVALGAVLGAVLEILSMAAVPAGGVRLDDHAVATVVGVATGASLSPVGALPVALAWAVVSAEIGGYSVQLHRHANGRRWSRVEEAGMSIASVSRAHWLGIITDVFRGMLLVGVLTLLGRVALGGLASAWPLAEDQTAGVLLVIVSIHLGAQLPNFGGLKARGLLLAGGLVAGFAIGGWLR